MNINFHGQELDVLGNFVFEKETPPSFSQGGSPEYKTIEDPIVCIGGEKLSDEFAEWLLENGLAEAALYDYVHASQCGWRES